MRPTKCLLTPARAFHRALLLEFANTTHNNSSTLICSSTFPIHKSLPLPIPIPIPRPICAPRAATTTTTAPWRRRVRSFTTSPAPRAAWKRGTRNPSHRVLLKKHPRDENIRVPWVRIVDEDGNLSEPQRIEAALATRPRDHSLVMVAPPPAVEQPPLTTPGVMRMRPQPPAAICRLVNVVVEKAMIEAAEKESKKMAQQTKTLEMGWAIAPHDLGHRMKRFQEFLGKGLRVEILLARKRGSRKVEEDEARELVDRIREYADAIPGVQEYKKMSGDVGGVVMMFFQGKKPKTKTKEGPEEDEEDEGERKDV